ncbi:hypothetical protein EKH57_15900 [Halorubrum sp. BOL3-1]|uniref:hypothetical protein n=1 Tax=Halorubrum sp. BOL3-1 TaxID=2497325 RepID=UPI00100512E9|nr:hypothetical protein [Halorubrum sp. BOL3-1]QAU14062.1 hypothetical protein EKH57_15900 [Halorubrum sp. BOL3-1]
MHATIDARFTISIDDHKTVPLAVLAEFLTEQNIESVLLEQLVALFGRLAEPGALVPLAGQKRVYMKTVLPSARG